MKNLCAAFRDSTTPLNSVSKISRLQQLCEAGRARPAFSQTWWKTPKPGFLLTGLIFHLKSFKLFNSFLFHRHLMEGYWSTGGETTNPGRVTTQPQAYNWVSTWGGRVDKQGLNPCYPRHSYLNLYGITLFLAGSLPDRLSIS